MQEIKTDAIRKVFVLGAGFSACAQFPLVRDLKEQVIQCARHLPLYKASFQPGNGGFKKGQFHAGLEMVDPSNSLQFEETLIALIDHLKHTSNPYDPCHRTLEVLKGACARLLWTTQSSIRKVAPCYANFVPWISVRVKSRPESVIITFNWDLLVEKTLSDSGIPWNYSSSKSSAIPILKPHGSINWNDYLHKGLRADYGGWNPIGPGSKLSYDAFNPLSDPDRNNMNPSLCFMIFPGDPESAKEDGDLQQLIWNWAAQAISERQAIVFVGYSLPQYDSFSVDFFSRLSKGKVIEVYNPSKDHLERFRYIFGEQIILKQLKFEDCKYAKSPY